MKQEFPDPVKKNVLSNLPDWWIEADIVKPPCFGEVILYLDEKCEPCHSMYLWKARILDRDFFVYLQTWTGYRKRNYQGRFCHGFRIDHDSDFRTSFPNRSQFESALFFYQNTAMDHNLLLEKENKETYVQNG